VLNSLRDEISRSLAGAPAVSQAAPTISQGQVSA
jgi:hypothetical protein